MKPPQRTIRAKDLLLVADVMCWVWVTWAAWVGGLMLMLGKDLTSPAWVFVKTFPGHHYLVGGSLLVAALITSLGLALGRTTLLIVGIAFIGAWAIGLSYQLTVATKHLSHSGTLSGPAWLLIGLLCVFHAVLLIRGSHHE